MGDRYNAGLPLPQHKAWTVRENKWRAARYGLEADLISVQEGRAVPAGELIERLLARLREALEADGAWEEVSELVRATLARGNGAARQRAAFSRGESFEAVVDYILAQTSS